MSDLSKYQKPLSSSESPRKYYNIEIGPGLNKESELDAKEVKRGEHNYHTNKFLRLNMDEANQPMIDSSNCRLDTFATFNPPQSKADILTMLGDNSGGEHCVFRENDDMNEFVKTICVGLFDLKAKTYSLYSDNPKNHEPHVTIPLFLKQWTPQVSFEYYVLILSID